MPRRTGRKQKQPPCILLDHNIQAVVAERLHGLARFRQIGETELEHRFRSDVPDPEIHRGPRLFLFVTHDRDFLRPERLPNDHGGVLVFVCQPADLATALGRFLVWWGPQRNLLRGRVFRLTATGGAELLRDGSYQPIKRRPAERRDPRYGA